MTQQSCHSISVPFMVVFPWIGPILLGCRETNPSFVLVWSVCSRDHDPLSEQGLCNTAGVNASLVGGARSITLTDSCCQHESPNYPHEGKNIPTERKT